MSDLEYLHHLVQIQKKISADVMKENKYPSGVYIQAKGSYGAYETVEAYIQCMLNKKLKKGDCSNGCNECLS